MASISWRGCIVCVDDALCLLEAACAGIIPFTTQRLTRQLVSSGSVYVVDARQSKIWRWTDGHRWKPHRSRRGFWVYREIPTIPVPETTTPLSPDTSKQIRDIVGGGDYRPTDFIKQVGQYIFNCTISDTNL